MKSNHTLLVMIAVLMLGGTSLGGETRTASDPFSVTVKITRRYIRPIYCTPWKMSSYRTSVGSGVIIRDNRILTNAHVVSDVTYLQVQKENDPKLYEAEVEYVGHECDLALLRVKDAGFFQNTTPLELGGIPRLKSVVATYGYPTGGSRISITEGVVSRIEIGNYVHTGKLNLLMIQTDAAINHGNSGGPVIQNGKIVGIAFQARPDASNIGYMIPVPVIKHFLADIADGRYDGFPDLGVYGSNLINKSYREYLGMSSGQSGILVNTVIRGGSCDGLLKSGDVILSIDGVTIANDGTIPFEDGRIQLTYIADCKQAGERVRITVLRDKKELTLMVALKCPPVRIPWYDQYEANPRYFIFGGIVFQQLTREYLKCWDKWWYNANQRMLYYYSFLESDDLHPERKEFVIINHILPDPANTYVSSMGDLVVERVNGVRIRSLEDVIKAVGKPLGGNQIIIVEGLRKPIILPHAALKEANERILKKYRIPRDRRLDPIVQ